MPVPRRSSVMFAVAILVVLVCMAGLYLLLHDSIDDTATAEQLAAQRAEDAQSARDALQAQCDVGIQSACDQLAGLDDVPVPNDPDDPEVQDNEIQEPEVQNPDPDDPERQDPERQNPEIQNPEDQQPDADDPEQQDGEVNDPDPDDPDPDDPDPDDPDPNSLFTFAVRDECDPVPGEFVTNVGLAVEVTSDTVTYVVTCTTAPLPPLLRALL